MKVLESEKLEVYTAGVGTSVNKLLAHPITYLMFDRHAFPFGTVQAFRIA